jgi:hypothetical protein
VGALAAGGLALAPGSAAAGWAEASVGASSVAKTTEVMRQDVQKVREIRNMRELRCAHRGRLTEFSNVRGFHVP